MANRCSSALVSRLKASVARNVGALTLAQAPHQGGYAFSIAGRRGAARDRLCLRACGDTFTAVWVGPSP
jgi:hypothetical protein